MTYNATALTLSVYSDSNSSAGVYDVVILISDLSLNQTYETGSISVTISEFNWCLIYNLQVPTISSVNYTVYSGSKVFTFSPFTWPDYEWCI